MTAMKTTFACLIFFATCSAGLRAADVPSPEAHPADPAKNEASTPASLLAEQVKQIAATPDMAAKTKAKLISNAVQLAVNQALAGIDDPAEQLNLAEELAAAAAKAAPQFSDSITQAVMGNSAIARIDGALTALQASVQGAAREAGLTGRGAAIPSTARSDFGGNIGDKVVSPSF